VYEFIINEDEAVQNALENIGTDEDPSVMQTPSSLSFPEKCYFANKKLEQLNNEYELTKAGYNHELQNLRVICLSDSYLFLN